MKYAVLFKVRELIFHVRWTWPGLWLYLFFLHALFLIACQSGANQTPTSQSFVPQDFMVEPKPPFISEVYPSSQSRMTLTEFQENRGGRVCVKWTATQSYQTATQYNREWLVVEPGDEDFDLVVHERTSLIVNDQVSVSAVFTAHLLETIVTFESGEELRVGGPFNFCWLIESVIGRNFATFQVRKTSGDIFSYSWYFDLTP